MDSEPGATAQSDDRDGRPRVALIAAVSRNGAIGRNNALLWKLSGDMKHFRQTTTGSPVVMGRKTWDSIGRPLPGRTNVVVTRQAGFTATGAVTAASLVEALSLAAAHVGEANTVYVIGGAQIYAEALPLADELVMTEVDADFDGDTFFPAFDRASFEKDPGGPAHEEGGLRYAFVTYRRKR